MYYIAEYHLGYTIIHGPFDAEHCFMLYKLLICYHTVQIIDANFFIANIS